MVEKIHNEIPLMLAKVRNNGSGGLEVTLDKRVAEYLGLNAGDTVKLHVKKVPEELPTEE